METDSMQWIDAVLADGEHAARLRNDLPYFAEHALKLRPKSGPLEPFILNPAQRKLHEIIEQQRANTGRVRVIVLKARQLGVRTYVAARLYQRTIHNPGVRTIIIGHERRASSNLFQIVKRFHEHSPEDSRPSIGISNAEELIFDRIDSGYIVSVATSEGTGRSATAQLLHASEAAFWFGEFLFLRIHHKGFVHHAAVASVERPREKHRDKVTPARFSLAPHRVEIIVAIRG